MRKTSLKSQEESRKARLDEIRKQVLVGLEQLDAGKGAKWNLQEVIDEGQKLLVRQQAKH